MTPTPRKITLESLELAVDSPGSLGKRVSKDYTADVKRQLPVTSCTKRSRRLQHRPRKRLLRTNSRHKWTRKRVLNYKLVTNGAFCVKITTQQIDARYALKVYEEPVCTAQGDLRLFEINPQPADPGLPSFSGRWDHHQNTVDIDASHNGRYEKAFRGHHTVTASAGIYDCDIYVPEGHIFTASVAL